MTTSTSEPSRGLPPGTGPSSTLPATTSVALSAAGGHATVRSGGGLLRVCLLERGPARARVALVPTTALLLAGDHVRISVSVGPGCHLEVTEPAGTVAYDMAGGEASWDVEVDVAPGGRLVWHAPELVVSQGARVGRHARVVLHGDAGCLMRETFVLGRTGEAPGLLDTATEITRDGLPVLTERLRTGTESRAPGVLGGNRVLDQVVDLTGTSESTSLPGPDAMRLAGGGTLHRRLGRHAHDASLDATWRRLVDGGHGAAAASGRIAT